MNSLLADLQKEREERRLQAQGQNQETTPGAGTAQDSKAADAETTGSRKRKQTNPVRRNPGGGGGGDILVENQKEHLHGDDVDRAGGSDNAQSHSPENITAKKQEASKDAKAAKKRCKSAPKASENYFSAPDSSVFDAASIAAAWALGDFSEGRNTYGEMAYDQFASAARVHAASNGTDTYIHAFAP